MRKIGLLLLLLAFNTHALRCGNKVIEVGDSVFRLTNYCGEPTKVIKSPSVIGSELMYIYNTSRGVTLYVKVEDLVITNITSTRF